MFTFWHSVYHYPITTRYNKVPSFLLKSSDYTFNFAALPRSDIIYPIIPVAYVIVPTTTEASPKFTPFKSSVYNLSPCAYLIVN